MSAQGQPHYTVSASWLARLLAVVLALGGFYWGFLLAWIFLPGLIFRLFGPEVTLFEFGLAGGYLITAFYIVRSARTPPLVVRRLMWITSLLVQGSWLAWGVWCISQEFASGDPPKTIHFVLWWMFATVASLVGLIAERPKHAERVFLA